MQSYFYAVADELTRGLTGAETLLLGFHGEDSDFVRLNHAKVRQAGSVHQRSIALELVVGGRHASASTCVAGDAEIDLPRLRGLLEEVREKITHLPDDPHFLYATEVQSSERIGASRLPSSAAVIEEVATRAQDLDLVGIYAAGGIHAGFANSLGQRNWYSNTSFNLDWSCYHEKDKAVKSRYAGFDWSSDEFVGKLDSARQQLAVLARPARSVEPGAYRVYLSPGALNEFLGTVARGGFGLKDHRTKQTSLLQMIEGSARMSPMITLRENVKEGVSADFQGLGFRKADEVTLIDNGVYRDCLISPRSAREYGVPTNGAGAWESPGSLDLAAGEVPRSEVLARLGTGVYINNLWYLNYSDRPACRITGMTRFATFWVENGEIVAPLNVMRFDETAYRVLGENLIGLTRERDLILDPDTYGARSTSSARLPGALVDRFQFTL